MATQKVTVELPQAIFQQLARIASATRLWKSWLLKALPVTYPQRLTMLQ
ncbi:hypothetical protein [Scytonema sp. NUACC26]